MTDPAWLEYARQHEGQAEVPGVGSNPWIEGLWSGIRATWLFVSLGRDDSSAAWCGAYVGECLRQSHIGIAEKAYRARAWLDWGVTLRSPIVGCVVIFSRAGGGHVGFIVGKNQHGHLMVLGGNQGDRVSIAPFYRDRVLGYRWPREVPLPPLGILPLVASTAKVSTDES